MALFLSALMTASVQAAPPRAPVLKPNPEVGTFTEVWKLLSAWFLGHHLSPPNGAKAPDISSQIDPNGGQH
jgi:hypothetical protein